MDRAAQAWALSREHGVDREHFILGLAGADPYCLVPNFEKLLRESTRTMTAAEQPTGPAALAPDLEPAVALLVNAIIGKYG